VTDTDHRETVYAHLLELYGGDPFAKVFEASNAHREEHAPTLAGGVQECGVYPSEAVKMRLLGTLVQAVGAKRILEIGCGLGYSALWLADAAGDGTMLETIDMFPEHAELARGFIHEFGFEGRISVLEGDAEDVLQALAPAYDVIHDDGWFGQKPSYYERVFELLRPGGMWILSNWFLLDQAITGRTTLDWSDFAGPRWKEDVKDYARELTADERLVVSYIMQPSWVALAVRK
jgi:predicted O-methyltransferase YrrM